MRRILLWFALAFALGSPLQAQTVRVYDKVEFAPTEFHHTIYKMMEACSGVEGDYESVKWFIAKMILSGNPDDGIQWVGMWTNGGGTHESRITFDRESVYDGVIVSHEVLHAIFEGDVPMDVANRCVLDWYRLKSVFRGEE